MANIGSRETRIKGYAKQDGDAPPGEASDLRNIEKWSERTTANSQCAPRAKGGAMNLRDTASGPLVSRSVDAMMAGKPPVDKRAAAKADKNTDASAYMKSVRRES